MKNAMLVGGTILMLAAKSALGADNTGSGLVEFYRAHEFSLDGFGTASLGKTSIDNFSGSRVRHDSRLGVGVGLSYFVTRNIGFSTDAYSENNTGALVDSLSFNFVMRFPLGQGGLAPYAFGGGGHQFDFAEVWFAQVGAGLEYRFTPHWGAFIDARWVLPHETKYYGVARLGVRFAF